jgi:hypothetical protein
VRVERGGGGCWLESAANTVIVMSVKLNGTCFLSSDLNEGQFVAVF